MGYTVYDLSESVSRSSVHREDIKHVAASWGDGPGGSDWTGGFLMEMKDGRWLYLTGWCDYTGWGCQDGIAEHFFTDRPELPDLEKLSDEYSAKPEEWDMNPVDLNRWIAGEIEAMD